MSRNYRPGYLALYKSGELEERLRMLESRLEFCDICPRECGVNRFTGNNGYCNAGYLPSVSSICDHHGEEPVLSGTNGSGTVFFCNCNLACVFCQNYQISQGREYAASRTMNFREVASRIVALQNLKGVHNINFVSPGHLVPQMVRIIYEAIPLGLNVPIVYNSNGYDSVGTLRQLEGIISIYLPDFKYADDESSKIYSDVPGYREQALSAIKEMYRQVGDLQVDKRGTAQKGVIVRHLVLPNDLAETREVIRLLANEVSPDITISLMAQYHPSYRAGEYPLLSRPVTFNEYSKALGYLDQFKLSSGFSQQMNAPEYYLPDFYKEDHPFE
jgi:putative pyruvate formate lyase activating enzyme